MGPAALPSELMWIHQRMKRVFQGSTPDILANKETPGSRERQMAITSPNKFLPWAKHVDISVPVDHCTEVT